MSFGRTAARDGNQVRFLPAAQLALPARPRPVVDGGFESLIDEPSPRSGDSEGAYRNRLSRLAVRQPFVSFQQRKGPLYRAGQRLAPAGYLNQIGPLGWCQFDFVLYGRHIRWTLRILSGISEGICNSMVQSGGEFLYIGVGGWTLRISSGVSKGIYESVVQSGRDFPYIRVGGGQ